MPTFRRGFGTAPFFGDGGLSQTRALMNLEGENSMPPGSLEAIIFGGTALANWLTGRGQISQAKKDRAEQTRQWEEMFDRSEVWRLEDLARQQEALDFYRGVHSRAILGSTMQTDVPAYRPRYSEAEGVEREENPYGPYIYRPRSA